MRPQLGLGLPFKPMTVSGGWFDWPSLPDLFPVSFPGVTTNRDSFLVDTDLDRLRARVADYFDAALSHEEIARRYPVAMKNTTSVRQDARSVREGRLVRGGPDKTGFLRYCHRPFDTRWLYWESKSGLLARPSPDYRPHVFEGNLWVEARQREARDFFSRGTLVRHLAGDFGNGRSHYFPAWLRDDSLGASAFGRRPNLSSLAQLYLERLDMDVEDLFYHVIAVLHDPAYREANAGALRMDWSRISLFRAGRMASTDGAAKAACCIGSTWPRTGPAARSRNAGAGRYPRPVASRRLRPLPCPPPTDGRNMTGDDFKVTAGWGHFGTGDTVMPGQGRIVERAYTPGRKGSNGLTTSPRSVKPPSIYT